MKKSITLMILSAFCFSLMSLSVKLAGDVPSFEKALFRNMISLAIAFSILKARGQSLWGQRQNRRVLILRGITGSAGILLYFYSIDHLILADSSMLNKLSPFFVILFARLFLGHRVKRYQVVSVAIAFSGAFLIIKPGFNFAGPLPAVIGALSAVFAGLAYIMVSHLGGKENSYTIVFYFSLISSLICIPLTLIDPVLPSWGQAGFLISAGITAAGGQFLLTAAYRYAPPGEISIYQYSQIIFAGVLGLVFFSELPDLLSLTGYVLIIAAGYLMYRLSLRRDR